jgi:DNA polymerase III subunit gamma/tau
MKFARTVLAMSVEHMLGATSGSLAVRYRPHRFSEIVGQRHVKVPLQRAVATGLLPQQLLFSGGSGLGKTTIARICAAALFCEMPMSSRSDADCCGTCPSCRDIVSGTHPDVIEIDAASNGRVDEIREIAARAHLSPLRGTHRVYIVDEAHGLSPSGGQAFLKLLEEPPPHVMFMLATTDPQKMLHTNRSRCVEFELMPPSRDDVVQHLIAVAREEGVDLDEDSASVIVAASERDLGLRGVMMSLEKLLPLLRAGTHGSDLAEVLGSPPTAEIQRLCRSIYAGSVSDALAGLAELRSRFSAAKLLVRLGDELRLELVRAAEAGARSRFETVARCCDEVVTAARNGGDLAATMSVVHMCAQFGLDLSRPDTAGHQPGTELVPVAANRPDPVSETVETAGSAGGSTSQSASKTDAETADAPYAYDPFSAEPTATPDAVVSDAGSDSPPIEVGDVSVEGVLGLLGARRSPAARLLAAKIRAARCAEESETQVLYVQPGTFTRLSVPELEMLRFALSELCGSTQVDVRPEPR